MKESRSALVKQIAVLDKRLQERERRVVKHEQYLENFVTKYKLPLLALLLPALWYVGKKGRGLDFKRFTKPLLDYAAIGLFSILKNKWK